MSTLSTYEIIRNQLALLFVLSSASAALAVLAVLLLIQDYWLGGVVSGCLCLGLVYWNCVRYGLLLRLIKAAADVVDSAIQPQGKRK